MASDTAESACRHLESAWSCAVRAMAGLAPLKALTVAERVRAVLVVEERHIESSTHSWIDLDLPVYAAARRIAAELSCPALVVARYDDAVLFVDASKAGPTLALCGSDGHPRVRLEVNKMSPVRFESRW